MTPREIELTRELEKSQTALKEAHQKIALLEQKVDLLVRRIFGASSEKLDPAQLDLFLLPPAEPVKEEPVVLVEKTSTPKRKPATPRMPENLPVVEQVIDPEPVKAAPGDWRCIGEEVTEQLDYQPGQFLRRRTVRKKYVHRSEVDKAPVVAPLPEGVIPHCLAAPGLLAQVIVSKYCDHLPLYRQEQIFQQRHGVHLPRQTLARWMEVAADWLQLIYLEIRSGVLAGGYVQIDETPIEYLDPGNKETRLGYFWTCHRPGEEVFYQWETSRAASCLEKIIPVDFKGFLQCDGFSAYPAFAAKRSSALCLAACWAHVRRKFHDALKPHPKTAGWFLRQIQHLYRIEAGLREKNAGPKLRQAVRAHQSQPIVNRIFRAIGKLKEHHRYLPQSLLGQAMDYALGQKPGLEIFLNEGRIEIDNNLVENAIRPTALGKKNWLFIGAAEAGQRGAILYTIVESCRRLEIDPLEYLTWVLGKLPHATNQQVKVLTPSSWARSKSTTTTVIKAVA